MSLSSKEDQQLRRQEKQKKRPRGRVSQRNRQRQPERPEETMQSSDAAKPDVEDCWTANRKAIETTRVGNYDAYVPECQADGRYQPTQCFKVKEILSYLFDPELTNTRVSF